MNDYKIGDIIKCRVSGIENYGIFVQVDDSTSGLIHISEVSNDFVKDVNNYVELDEIIYCQVLDVNENNSQLKLSIKNINYKSTNDSGIEESRLGFLPLKEALPKWIDEALERYNEK